MTHSATENMKASLSSNSSTQAQQTRPPSEAKQISPMDIAVSHSGSPLLNLPRETRQQILRLLLPYTSFDDRYGPVWHHGCTSLLDTCHLLRKECVAILYSSNTFVFKISPHGPPRFIVQDSSSRRPSRAIRSLIVNPEPEIHLIRKLHIEIMESDTYFRAGDRWEMMNWPENKRLERSPLVLQGKVKQLVEHIPQWGGGIKTATILWLVNKTRVGWQQRKTILQPLRDAGVQVEEEIMLEVERSVWG